jgi:hypothetical protein
MLTHAAWSGTAAPTHGFLDAGECLASPDWPSVLARLGVSLPLVRPRQVHGATVLLDEEVTATSEGDAVVTTRPGIAVGIVTADCAPILLRDRRDRVVAAVHAGWRGAVAGVVERTLAVFRQQAGVEPADVEAVIGPAAGGCCYEVGDDVRRAFTERPGIDVAHAFTARRDRFLFDLRAAVATIAMAAGVPAVRLAGPCTICERGYASYRRDGAAAGRQLSFIALR